MGRGEASEINPSQLRLNAALGTFPFSQGIYRSPYGVWSSNLNEEVKSKIKVHRTVTESFCEKQH